MRDHCLCSVHERQPGQSAGESGPWHSQVPGSVRDVAASLGDEPLGIKQKAVVQGIWATDPAAALAGCFQAADRVLCYKVSLELCHGGEDMENELPAGGRRVDPFGEGAKMDAVGLEAVQKVGQMMNGAPEPVELVDDKCVAGF